MLPLIIFGYLAFVHMHYLDNTKRQRQVELALTEAGALGTYPVKVHTYTHHLHFRYFVPPLRRPPRLKHLASRFLPPQPLPLLELLQQRRVEIRSVSPKEP
jgi:hypothetical protein